MGTVIVPVIIGIVFIALVFRLIAGGMDHDRVDAYIADHGGRVLEKRWNPFGKGWCGEKDARIYEVRYQDAAGDIHEATCKTRSCRELANRTHPAGRPG